MKDNYVYILRCKDGSYYTGYTNDLEKRIEMHNEGKASKYTAPRIPVRFVFTEKCKDKSDALKKEHFIKTLDRNDKDKLINYEINLEEIYQEYLIKRNEKSPKNT